MDQPTIERRKHVRYRVAVMYSEVAATPAAVVDGSPMHGHVYDISKGGVRIELDEALEVGRVFELEMKLPGMERAIWADGHVIWVASPEDDPGPRRMALEFKAHRTADDGRRLRDYLASRQTCALA